MICVNSELEELGAAMFGMEAALFTPSGIMGNLTAIMSHCWERGSEVILGDLAHVHLMEQGGISQVTLCTSCDCVNKTNADV